MSIYVGSRRGWKDLNDVVQTIPRPASTPAPANSAQRLQDSTDWDAR